MDWIILTVYSVILEVEIIKWAPSLKPLTRGLLWAELCPLRRYTHYQTSTSPAPADEALFGNRAFADV